MVPTFSTGRCTPWHWLGNTTERMHTLRETNYEQLSSKYNIHQINSVAYAEPHLSIPFEKPLSDPNKKSRNYKQIFRRICTQRRQQQNQQLRNSFSVFKCTSSDNQDQFSSLKIAVINFCSVANNKNNKW